MPEFGRTDGAHGVTLGCSVALLAYSRAGNRKHSDNYLLDRRTEPIVATSPVSTPTSPLDATGHAAEKRARQTAKDKQVEQDRITTARAQEVEELATGVYEPKRQQAIVLDEVEEVGVVMADDSVIIRTIVDIDQMTYGVGNEYNFRQGVKYKVPRDLAKYLESLGYLWIA